MSLPLTSDGHLKLDDDSLKLLLSSNKIPEQLKSIYILLHAYGITECEQNVPLMLLEFMTSLLLSLCFLSL